MNAQALIEILEIYANHHDCELKDITIKIIDSSGYICNIYSYTEGDNEIELYI